MEWNILNLDEGQQVAFLGKVESWAGQVTIMSALGSRTRVAVQLKLRQGNWTLYGYCVSGTAFGFPLLVPTKTSKEFPEPVLEKRHFQQCVELCCGIGGISLGVQRLGWATKVFVDHSALASQTIANNGGQVICGRVEDQQVQQQVHQLLAGERAIILAGFPCQPYSILGSGSGLKDQRGQTLFSVLRIAWLTRASAVILECVAEVSKYKETMHVLQEFADASGFQFQTVTLDLSDQWPARRRRWWGVMVPKGTDFALYNWEPDNRFSSIDKVLAGWPSWPVAEEEDLRWTAEEKSKYGNPEYGQDSRRLEISGVMPTALHSWGNALRACPCGCRSKGFADDRLKRLGLRGFAIWSEVIQDLRFPHPKEVAYLTTLPAEIILPQPPRDALCMVGQLAAPMQALWVASQVQGWVQRRFDGFAAIVPAVCLEQLKQQLLLSQPGLAPTLPLPSPFGFPSPETPRVSGLPGTPAATPPSSLPLGFPSPEPMVLLQAKVGQEPGSDHGDASTEAAAANQDRTSPCRPPAPNALGCCSPKPRVRPPEPTTCEVGSRSGSSCLLGFPSPQTKGLQSTLGTTTQAPAEAFRISRTVRLSTDAGSYSVQLATTTTVAELCQAEGKLHGPGVSVSVSQGDRLLSGDAILDIGNSAEYLVQVRPKKQARRAEPLLVLVLTAAGIKSCPGHVGDNVLRLLQDACIPNLHAPLDLATQQPVTTLDVLKGPVAIDVRPAAAPVEQGMSDTMVWAALRQLCVLGGSLDTRILPPSVATLILACQPHDLQRCKDPIGPASEGTQLLTVFQQDGHWALLVLKVQADGLVLPSLFDGIPGRSVHAAEILAWRISQLWNRLTLPLQEECWIQQESTHSCGAIALLHASQFLLGSQEVLWRMLPELAASAGREGNAPRAWAAGGLSKEQEQAFRSILLDRGVTKQQVEERVAAAVARIGAAPIAKALAHKNPWPALKTAASQPGSNFKYVTAEELEAQIESRASQRFGSAIKQGKAKKQSRPAKGQPTVLHVDPNHLQLMQGSFITAEGGPLAQLSFQEVQAQKAGVAFCTAAQTQPFLVDFQTISVDALALVSTATLPDDVLAGRPASHIRYPATYAPTGEPILIRGTILQLGDESVELAKQDITELEPVQTLVLRMSIYKDEANLDWAEFGAAPIKCAFNRYPCFSLCQDNACPGDCPRFHCAVDEPLEQLVMDIWARQWAKLDGGRTVCADAAAFHALIRVPASSIQHFQNAQAQGVYFEPRSSDGFSPHPGYAVIWLPHADRAAAQHALRTCEKALCLARLGRKWGLRVKEADEESVFTAYRPGVSYIKVAVNLKWRIHPLPCGLQRQQLAALLKRWNWKAKPLQPLKADAAGMAWLIGSEDDPPSTALPVGNNFAIVTLQKGPSQGPAQVPLCASRKTKRHIIYDDGEPGPSDSDPWMHGPDPWTKAATALKPPPGLAPPPQEGSATSKLDKLRQELKDGVAATVQTEWQRQSESALKDFSASQEDRFRKLEVSVTELRLQNDKFEGWFSKFGQQVSENASQIKTVDGKLEEQQRQLAKVHHEVTRTAEVVNQSVTSAVGALGAQLGEQLQAQMMQQTALLQELTASKKARSE